MSSLSLFLHSCDADGRGFAFLGGIHRGIAGENGATGPAGENGRDGVDGVDGVDGTSGMDGATGRAGPRGPRGVVGPTGPAGVNGIIGVNGSNGTDGVPGTQGPRGEIGPPGTDGAPGTQGPQGETGLRGPAGEIGPEGPSGLGGLGDSGYFWDTTTQGDDGPGGYEANTPYAMRLNNSDVLNNQGISIVNDSRISFTKAGVYNIAFSAQIYRSQGGSSSNMSIWLRRNGVNVPDSTTDFILQGSSARYVAAWNFFVPVACTTQCDYYELVWSAENATTSLLYVPPQVLPDRPGIPSLIVTVNQVK